MANICPKCSADTESLGEESKNMCIHEQAGTGIFLFFIGVIVGLVIGGVL